MADETKKQGNNLSMVGDAVGQLLGIPGQLLGGAGEALVNSIRPDGKISLLRLMDVGGVRTSEMKARDLATKAQEAQLKAQELANQYEPQRQTAAHAMDVAKLQGLDPSTQRAVADALFGGANSPQGGPTTEQDQARHDQAAQWGLTDQSIQEAQGQHDAAVGAYGSALGLTPAQAAAYGPALGNVGGEDLGKSALGSIAERQKQGNRVALEGIKQGNRLSSIAARGAQSRQTAAERIVSEPLRLDSLLSATRSALPPQTLSATVKVEDPGYAGKTEEEKQALRDRGIPQYTEKTVREYRPRTQADWDTAVTQATATIDKLREYQRKQLGLSPKSISLEEAANTRKTKARMLQLQQAGADPETAAFTASMEASGGAQNVIRDIPPANVMPADQLVPQLAEVVGAMDKAAKVGSPAMQGVNVGQMLKQKLTAAGYSEADANTILKHIANTIRLQEGS